MVAIHFTSPEQNADGFMLLVRQGRVRALRGEIYIVREESLAALDAAKIAYEKLPLPLSLEEVVVMRDTPTTKL